MRLRRRPAVGALGPLSLSALLGCEARPVVVVRVSQLPATAATLEVSVKLGGAPADDLPPFPLPMGNGAPQSFGLRLPRERPGPLVIGAGALDDGACLRAVGFAELDYRGEAAELDLGLGPVPGDQLACGSGAPVIFGVTPSLVPTSGGAQLSVRGWGFQPGDQVSIAGVPAGGVLWRSRSELLADAPAYALQGHVPALVPLKVQSSAGKLHVRDDLLAYYPATLGFMPAAAPLTCRGPQSLALGDIDGDAERRLDLAVGCRDDGEVRILRNRGGGALQAGAALPAGARPAAVALTDLDGDGRPELLVASAGDNALLLRHPDGSGGFTDATPYLVGLQPVALAAADLDGNGLRDVAVLHQVSRDVLVLPGRGGAALGAADRGLTVGRAPTALVAADLDGDGYPDLATANRDSGTVTALRSLGGRGFQQLEVPAGAAPQALAAADLDGDGRAELLVGDGRDGAVRVLRLQDQRLVVTMSYPVAAPVGALLAADLNGDGRPELAVGAAGDSAATQQVRILRNDGRGALQAAQAYDVDPRPAALAAGDLDGDGLPEVVVASGEAGTITILWNRSR